jgi:hypothetical protein
VTAVALLLLLIGCETRFQWGEYTFSVEDVKRAKVVAADGEEHAAGEGMEWLEVSLVQVYGGSMPDMWDMRSLPQLDVVDGEGRVYRLRFSGIVVTGGSFSVSEGQKVSNTIYLRTFGPVPESAKGFQLRTNGKPIADL